MMERLAMEHPMEAAVETKSPVDEVDVERRTFLVAGAVGASALLAVAGGKAIAAESRQPKRVIIKEIESMIPGYPKIRLRENTYAPGSSWKSTMTNDMICECTEGSLDVKADSVPFTAAKGYIWVCKKGIVEEITNSGSTPAVMRVFDLLTA